MMKNTTKKKISVLMTALLLSLLIACGNTASQAPEAIDKTGSESSVEVNESSDTGDEADADSTSTDTSESVSSEESQEVEEVEEIYLKDIYAEHGVKVGTCITPTMTNSTTHTELITSQFNSVTMENAMKPDYIFSKTKSIESGELTVSFNIDMISMLDWAKENNMSLRGHTLIWYSQTPKWIFHEDFDTGKPMVSREVMLERMESMISQVFSLLEEKGYSELFYAYDIVNEAWLDDGKMRTSKNYWYQTIGEDYLWYAFYYADKYAPEYIDLYYNDFNEQYKSTTLANFVKTLVDEEGNYLIDGIGLQAHLYTQDDMNKYLSAVKYLGSTGLKLEITELDVSLGSYQKTAIGDEENLKKQGRYYYSLLKGIFDMIDDGTIKMDSITFWGYSDAMSWRRSANPLLYNSSYKKKYAYYGAAQILEKCGFDNVK